MTEIYGEALGLIIGACIVVGTITTLIFGVLFFTNEFSTIITVPVALISSFVFLTKWLNYCADKQMEDYKTKKDQETFELMKKEREEREKE